MPLPDYGYGNKEDKKHQELVFQRAPELVVEVDEGGRDSAYKARFATGKKKPHTCVCIVGGMN